MRFADDIDVLTSNCEDFQEMVHTTSEDGKKAGLILNDRKTETLAFGKEGACDNTRVNAHAIKIVDQLLYVGSLMTWNNDVSKDINRRIGKALGAMA